MASGLQGSQGPPHGDESRTRRWGFGAAVFDEASMELRVEGERVHLERKPLEVLRFLLHHAGEVVTKAELAENLWPGRILTETVLTRCISLLRRALQDKQKTLLRTAHGFGYRLDVVPTIELSAAYQSPPALTFKPGDSPPKRKHWKLVARLGAGGHGEAWLARHEKTHDERVFKFAVAERALTSLKREITIYRALRDTLGTEVGFLQILDWNLEDPPYFLEVERAQGGNLADWSQARGGLQAVPLNVRLEVGARIADALAAAHSVGVLHRDLKPENILIDAQNEPNGDAAAPKIRLCDFGSGGIDAERLKDLGITRLGFTNAMPDDCARAATPLYLAPEVVAGQPFTVKADIYSLGVILYQLLAGQLNKSLTPGWELDIEDELLREDLAVIAAGNPARRLADAAEIAVRLRSLTVRRRSRAAASVALARTERTERIAKELRRTRLFAAAVSVFACLAVVGGAVALRARSEARTATAAAKAVNDFLTEDVFRLDPSSERPLDATYESILTRSAERVDARLGANFYAAGTVHWQLGRRFQEIGDIPSAVTQYERASEIYSATLGADSPENLETLERLAWNYVSSNRSSEARSLSAVIQKGWARHLSPDGLSILAVRIRLARLHAFLGDFDEAKHALRSVLDALPSAGPPDSYTLGFIQEWLGFSVSTDASRLRTTDALRATLTASAESILGANILLEHEENYRDAETLLRRALKTYTSLLGRSVPVAVTQWTLAYTISMSGKFTEAEELIEDSQLFLRSWLPARHWMHSHPIAMLARVRLEELRPHEALQLASQARKICIQNGCSRDAVQTFAYDLGLAHEMLGAYPQAVEVFRELALALDQNNGPGDLGALKSKIRLATALALAGSPLEARDVMSSINKIGLRKLPPSHQLFADHYRLEGLVGMLEKQPRIAEPAFRRALELVSDRYGRKSWRTRRAVNELHMAERAVKSERLKPLARKPGKPAALPPLFAK